MKTMKAKIKFRDIPAVLVEGACYVCVDEDGNRKMCLEDHIVSRRMMAAAINAVGHYDVTGIRAKDGESCFILRRPWEEDD